MSRWRRVALEKIPQLKQEIETAPNAMSLWIDLYFQIENAYQSPENEVIKDHIFDYAHWCLYKSKNNDIVTAVIVSFYEHLPINKKIRKDLPNRISIEDFFHLGYHWGYFLTEKELQEFGEEFLATKRREII